MCATPCCMSYAGRQPAGREEDSAAYGAAEIWVGIYTSARRSLLQIHSAWKEDMPGAAPGPLASYTPRVRGAIILFAACSAPLLPP